MGRRISQQPTRRPGVVSPGRRWRTWALLGALLPGVAALFPGAVEAQSAPAPAAEVNVTQPPATLAAPSGRGVVVPAGARVEGNVIVGRTPLDVYGTVDGSAIALGDIVVHPGARVTGDVISILGTATAPAGAVGGAVRAMEGPEAPARSRTVTRTAAPSSPMDQVQIVAGWLVILAVIGIGVLVTASPYLDGVAEALEVSFSRALAVGFVGQLLVLPALLALVVALAITIVGALAIPLGVVAFVLAVAGLVTLGFLAVAFVTGRSLVGGRTPASRPPGARRSGRCSPDSRSTWWSGSPRRRSPRSRSLRSCSGPWPSASRGSRPRPGSARR